MTESTGRSIEQARRVTRTLWLAMGVFAPVSYGVVSIVLQAAGYEPVLAPDAVWRAPLLLLGLGALGGALLVRRRISELPAGHPGYLAALVATDTLGVAGLLVYLLLGFLDVSLVLCLLAVTAGWLLRPSA